MILATLLVVLAGALGFFVGRLTAPVKVVREQVVPIQVGKNTFELPDGRRFEIDAAGGGGGGPPSSGIAVTGAGGSGKGPGP